MARWARARGDAVVAYALPESPDASEAELRSDHYAIIDLPPVAELVADSASQFSEVGRWSADNVEIVVWRRLPADELR